MDIIKAELLAPAGSYDSLRAAINAGADAVYMGGSYFGARAYAENPDNEKLKDAIDYVHLHDKKLYLTVNTLLKNDEIKFKLFDYLNPLYKQGLDAVIVQDFGVFKFIRESFPELDIHASTQMTITGVDGARLMKEAGAVRVVTARELSLKEIKCIYENVDIEIESFIHGALCYCYSGQCLLSSMLGGRSGNRGRCAQPCRLPYDITGSNFKNNQNEKYLMSPKDICTINILPDILESGVYSLKIEGRMKSPEYVAGVTEIYRKYLDIYLKNGKDYYNVSDDDYKKLTDLYSRSGFSDGYYNCHNGRHMITLSKPSYNSVDSERITELHNKYVAKDKKLPVNIKAYILKNQPMKLELEYKNYKSSVTGNIPDLSTNQPATSDKIEKQLIKFGGTPFEAASIDIDLDDGLFIPVKSLNELRRNAVKSLIDCMLQYHKRNDGKSIIRINCDAENTDNIEHNINIICSVESSEQMESLLYINEIKSIYLSSDFLDTETIKKCVRKCHEHQKKCYITLPFIFRNGAEKFFEADYGADGYVVKNVDELFHFKHFGKELIADYSLYTMNDLSGVFLRENGISSTTAPLELNEKELWERNNINDQIIVYGYMPLMVTAGCGKKTMNVCDNKNSIYKLKDRYQKIFRVKTSCRYCYNILYNCQPLSLLKFSSQIEDMKYSDIRLNFTFESGKETVNIAKKFINNFLYHENENDIDNLTRGHFKRKVD
ncbi:MAG: U32 family peptidase [Lachnospiraceae bacterium]|nr:U32 family peptidase [Lachnospiraceae bacterium]